MSGVSEIFIQTGVVVCIAAFFALCARALRLPLLIGYLAAGASLGPLVSSLVPDHTLMEGLRSIGFALLLFLAGMELDWTKVRHQLKSTSALSAVLTLGSFTAGLAIAHLTNASLLTGMYLGLALSFSSTVVVVKLLSESGDLRSLHGRLAISTLLTQDFLSITALLILSGLLIPSQLSTGGQLILLAAKVVAIFAITWITSRHFLPSLFHRIARSTELLLLSSLAWCFAFAITMSLFDFPIEIGAFLAGISLGSLPFGKEIAGRVRPVHDFFVILLFVALGSTLVSPSLPYVFITLTLFWATVLVRPCITLLALLSAGYRSRTAFFTALTQSQLSEFSLLIIGLGVSSGQMPAQLASSLSATAIASIVVSTLLFSNRQRLYSLLRRPLQALEHLEEVSASESSLEVTPLEDHVVLFGYHRMGYHIIRKLREMNASVLVVDFDPDVIANLKETGVAAIYGDVEDEHVLAVTQIERAALIICTIPRHEETLHLLRNVRRKRSRAQVIVTAHAIEDALEYYRAGADYVILPYQLAGSHIGDLLEHHRKNSLVPLLKHKAEEQRLLRTKRDTLYQD